MALKHHYHHRISIISIHNGIQCFFSSLFSPSILHISNETIYHSHRIVPMCSLHLSGVYSSTTRIRHGSMLLFHQIEVFHEIGVYQQVEDYFQQIEVYQLIEAVWVFSLFPCWWHWRFLSPKTSFAFVNLRKNKNLNVAKSLLQNLRSCSSLLLNQFFFQ